MKKILTFAAAVLASLSMFAATIDDVLVINDSYSINFDSVVNATVAKETVIGEYFFSPLGNNYANNKGNLNGHLYCLRVKSATQDALGFKLDRAATLVLYADRVSDRAPKLNTEIAITGDNLIEGVVELGAEGQRWGKVTYTIPAGGTYYIVGTGDLFLARLEFTLEAACQDPELTVSEGGVGFVGDVINIAISSLNQSKPINPAVTVDGVAGVYGTDYTFSASTGLVQATPLRAGRFVITFTQASNGTYCDAVDSAIYVISAKNPVTSFTVEGPTEARIGQEVTLTAKDFDAAATVIEWQDGENEVLGTGATYTFTPNAVGNYQFYVYASNEFNEDPVMEVHNVEVAISDNALLSDLKVNGETVEDFDEETYAYNLGQIGVYEALNVVATPEDAPYATVVVVDNGEGTITITVTAEDQESTEEYVLTYTRAAATELASISEGTTWDFTKTGATEIKFTDDTPIRKGVTEFNYADVLTNPDASFNAAALNGVAEYAVREGKYFQGSQLKFNTTVPGKLEVVYSNTGNRAADQDLERILTVNGVKIGNGALRSDTDVTESDIEISAGEVVLSSVLKSDESVQYIRIKKVAFTTNDATAIDNAAVTEQATKRIVNGQVIILRDGKTYNALGTEVR